MSALPTQRDDDASVATSAAPIAVGVVSFLNTLPLIDGLELLRDIVLRPTVPSLLIDQLIDDEVEIALCSSIDYQRSPVPLVIVPAGMLGCDGATMTVRLYSQRPIPKLQRVFCDTDSHTSITLLRILLMERFAIDPSLERYDAREHVVDHRVLEWPEAVLLIGDKVVTDSPPAVRYPYQLDLGEAWRELTGLPFVFAVWMAKQSAEAQRIEAAATALDRQRRQNRMRIDSLIADRAVPRGWPADLAREYLEQRLRFVLDARALQGLELFYDKAAAHGLIEQRRPTAIAAW